MEKYSKWRDAGTGIQPFLQPVPARGQQTLLGRTLGAAKNYVLGPVLSTTRLLALGVTAAIDTVLSTAGTLLLVVPRLHRIYTRCTRGVLARLALLVLGFFAVDRKTVSLQRGRRRGAGGGRRERGVLSGDLIVANHVSYVDVLWMTAWCTPVFVQLDNATMHARRVTMWEALRAPAHPPPALLEASSAQPLSNITQEARLKHQGPVVVFIENTTSNGRALLQPLPVFEELGNLDEKSTVHVWALKYPAKNFSPAYSVGSQAAHLFWLCAQVYNVLQVRMLAEDEQPRVSDSALFAEDEPVDLDDAVREKLVALSRLRVTRLTALDKRDFLAFYHRRAKGYQGSRPSTTA
ncbi:Vacuolar protein sorting protein vps66 [Coemansia sp. Benny D115]|nr:Vacuolar protein sorting protein vps66 [Coemansia sp. Benny D115]